MLTGFRRTLILIAIALLGSAAIVSAQVVYVVHAIDTESDALDDYEFNQELHLGSFDPDGSIAAVFDSSWRIAHLDSYDNPPIFTWYLMTHEAHCESNQGGNAIPEAMLSRFSDDIDIWGDEIGWHYHHSDWVDDEWAQLFTFNGSVYRDKPDTGLAVSQLAMLVLENGFFPESFRAGWTWENTQLSNWLEDLIIFDYSNRWAGVPPEANQWTSYHPSQGWYRRVGDMNRWISKCRQGGGALGQDDVNDVFELAQAQGYAILAFYSHNFVGNTMRFDHHWVEELLQNAAVEYGIPYRYTGAKEAMQLSLGVDDTIPPRMDVAVVDSVVYLQVNEAIYGSPFLAFRGTDLEYHAVQMEPNGPEQFSYRFAEGDVSPAVAVVAVTDLVGNSAVSRRLAGLNTCVAETPNCGDINGDGAGPNVTDLTYLIRFLFLYGQEPCSLANADFNSSGTFDSNDLVRLVYYLFDNGPVLSCP